MGSYLVHVIQIREQILYITLENSLSKFELRWIYKSGYNQPKSTVLGNSNLKWNLQFILKSVEIWRKFQ
jgi:hypothetical protein